MPQTWIVPSLEGEERDERDVDVCWHRFLVGSWRRHLRHSRPSLADGASLRRPDRETPRATARRGSVPDEDRTAAGPRPGGEQGARGTSTREGPRGGRLCLWAAA